MLPGGGYIDSIDYLQRALHGSAQRLFRTLLEPIQPCLIGWARNHHPHLDAVCGRLDDLIFLDLVAGFNGSRKQIRRQPAVVGQDEILGFTAGDILKARRAPPARTIRFNKPRVVATMVRAYSGQLGVPRRSNV